MHVYCIIILFPVYSDAILCVFNFPPFKCCIQNCHLQILRHSNYDVYVLMSMLSNLISFQQLATV